MIEMRLLEILAAFSEECLDYHIKCNTAPKKERHCVRFVLE